MSDKPSLHLPARDIPVPRSLSPAAQASLVASAARPHVPYPAPDDINGWLHYLEQDNAAGTPPWVDPQVEERATAQEIDLGGLPGFLAQARHCDDSDRILYNLHGGGLVGGGGAVCRMTSMLVAVSIQAKTYSIDYRMPPLYPYPAALEDSMLGYKFLLKHYPPERIVVRGSSAGGNLAAALMLRCRAQGVPFPAALILWTPELDLTESGDSFAVLTGADVVLKTSLMNINLLYANGHDLANPDLSPLFGDFAPGFPPTLLTAGTRDMFLSNAVRMHNALRRSGNHSELLIEEAMPHGGFFGSPEDEALAADVRDFADRAWAGKLKP
jgi:monoterpene epsilon-lactone hydrolase